MARLPVTGGDNDSWGSLLNDFLQQALDSDGTLLTGSTNTYTASANTNLASGSKPGLVQLAGDLTTPVTAPKVTGLQGKAVATDTPLDNQVLTWQASSSSWKPLTPSSGGVLGDIDGGSSSSVYGGVTAIDCGASV
ncbi:MAG: hypothetical protein WDN27_00425 [Candidatus Saccharibacteria bacterium]